MSINNVQDEKEFEDQKGLFAPEEDDTPLKIEPLDRRLITQPYDFSVKTIASQIDDKSLDTQPSFQRGYVWDDIRASRLIESLLMNIPIPVCYFAEEENGKFTVIDGHQRIFSIWRYLNNHFPLKNLETLDEYNKKYFKDLSEKEQRLILGRYIRCIVIAQESHPEIRFEVFERLNTGAMQVTDQEIRNAVYRGGFNNLIKDLAKSQRWLLALNKASLDKRMRDEELILRFFAVHEKFKQYQPPIKTFLNVYMREKTFKKEGTKTIRINPTDEEKRNYTNLFNQTMDKVTIVFEDHAFRAYIDDEWEKQINRPLFDAVTLVFSKLKIDDLKNKKAEIETELKCLFTNPEFSEATSGSKAHRNRFVTRVKLFSLALASIGLDSKIHEEFAE